ncbi:nickel-dependent hydrogenase large subunit [Thiobaca trueperi]|uniref:Coenzyme F420-reducing hydrogenase alpha subunit n=1 Tax=Thiobaca trueperi TaxID=127458 RepID=A0A4R3MRB7_9GAMM|nr:nickel-dependent hydrogenase large subunit [Thiobaca trueperi]TCT18040.1 coenzyme F420-reducing hydrogenase alpha subunit [Thiobaca trueperi]
MSDPAGRLNIQLRRTAQGRVCAIDSTRPVMASRLLVGRTPMEAAALLPILFSICGKAQASACVTALERADGLTPIPVVQAGRQRLVAVETIREHLWRILLDWPRWLDELAERADMADMLAQTKALFGVCDPDGQLFRPGAGGTVIDQAAFDRLLNELDARLARCLFGLPADHWLETIKDGRGFAHWCETTGTGAARLLRHLLDSGEAVIGQSSVAALPEIPDAELIARLTAPDGAEFIARPTWNGCAHETSPFTRRAACAPLPDLVSCYGRGILARLAAQLLEVACLLAEIRTDLADAPASTPVESGIGIGRAAAARGLLIHLAQVEQGRIRDYRILAPTEWNFHPQGVVAQALMGLPDAGDDTLKRQAEHIIMATDPCVAFDLTLPTDD